MNVTNALTTASNVMSIVTKLLPDTIKFVQTVEEVVPAKGQGAAKLEVLKGMLQGTFSTIQQAEVTFEQVWPSLSGTVTGLVKLFKLTGLFK